MGGKKAAAEHLKISPRTLDNWMKKTMIPTFGLAEAYGSN